MRDSIQIDKAGRVVLPKKLRERFRLNGGEFLTIEVRGDAIELRPAQRTGKLERVNGVLVYTGTGPLQEDRDFVAESREERLDELSKGFKKRR